MLIGLSTNGSASDGHVIIPNLDYKKDTFLEPSLVSNIHFFLFLPNQPSVMDMVIFRTIFFELFSFLHVHIPYPPFCLLTNLRNTPRQDQNTMICTAN